MSEIFQPNGVIGIAYLQSRNAIVSIGSLAKTAGATTTTPQEEADNPNDPLAPWGENNDFPDLLEDEIQKNTTLSGAIESKIDYLLAGGVEYGIESIVDGQKTWQYLDDPAYDTLLYSQQAEQYLAQSIHDYVKYRSIFPEIIFTADKSKAMFATAQKAMHGRWAIQSNLGSIDNAYLNANWRLGRRYDSADTIKVPVIDPLIDTPELIHTEKILKYIYRPPIATSQTYYPLVPWYSAKISGVLDLSNSIWIFKKTLLDRQMTPKFHLHLNQLWLLQKYGDRFRKATPEQMNKIFLDELKHLNEMMHGVENTGKNIATMTFFHDESQKWVNVWDIEAIKGETFSGEYIPDSEEADLHIHWAVGTDPTLQGQKKSQGQGAGSGSDKREAFNIDMSTNQRHVSVILSVFYFMRNYNGLNPKVKLRMKAPFLQTLNQVTPSERQTTPQK